MRHLEHTILFLIIGLFFGFVFGYCFCNTKKKIDDTVESFNIRYATEPTEATTTEATEPNLQSPTEDTLFTYRETTLITEFKNED